MCGVVVAGSADTHMLHEIRTCGGSSCHYLCVSLSVRDLVQTCSWIVVTAQLRRTRNQALTRDLRYTAEFHPHELPIPVEVRRPQSPFSTGHWYGTIQHPFRTCASRLVDYTAQKGVVDLDRDLWLVWLKLRDRA